MKAGSKKRNANTLPWLLICLVHFGPTSVGIRINIFDYRMLHLADTMTVLILGPGRQQETVDKNWLSDIAPF